MGTKKGFERIHSKSELVWDLFNPKPEFNYTKMAKNLDISTLDNPYVQVIWEDNSENFTQERIKSVKQYFMKKYASTNINVITKVKTSDEVQQTIDVTVNIMDKNYLKELIKNFLESKNQDQHYDQVLNIDLAVENRMLINEVEITPFKRWYIKKIEFSNFLSYGENQVIDFEKCNGITVVESDPPNFGGKTVLTVDLLLFLFFNTTTKTQKAEEIFNRFTDKNKVIVRGEIIIDGEEYLIARHIERKKSKSGDWTIKTELEFFKKLSDGQLLNFTGEQRRETEEFIKNSIGNIDDFLMTILTTASNLEDLLEAKPTARGQVLSRFLGLEFLKKKEETGKEIYSEFSKGMLSNVYNTESLKQSIGDAKESIVVLNKEIDDANQKISDVDSRLKKGQEYKDNLLNSKFSDIDQDLIRLNPITLQSEISNLENSKVNLVEQIKSVKIVEPKEFYHEDKHDEIKESMKNVNGDLVLAQNKVEEIEQLIKKFGDGIQCEHCGIKLMEAALTKKKIDELGDWEKKVETLSKKWKDLDGKEKSYTQLKKDFDEYERNKLIKEKYEISLESNNLKLEQTQEKLKRYQEVQDKIKKNNEIDAQLIKANMRIEDLVSEKRGYEKTLTTNQNQIKNLEEQIENNNDLILRIAEEFEREKIYKIYLEVFGKNGISKIIMKTMMPLINQELQRLLMDSCYFNLEIRINDKNELEFMMIDNSTGIEKLMTSGSGYERTIAAMALRAVLSKVCSLPKPNIIVWDEVFGKISNDNLEMVGEFFSKMREYFEKIFVITHNPLVNNWADNVVRITKTENISRVSQ
jgi:DNA repair exonuclease SbcCD ATPase subunit